MYTQQEKEEITEWVKEKMKSITVDPDEISMIVSDLWHEAPFKKDWEFAMVMYELFIDGIIPGSPTHGAPLTEDVGKETRDTFRRIIQLGFISVDSQPGLCERFSHNGISGEEVQREYIRGNYPIKYAQQLFINLLNIMYGDAYIAVNGPYSNYFVRNVVFEKFHSQLEYGRFGKERIPLTVAKLDTDDKWYLDTAGSRDHQFEEITTYPDMGYLDQEAFTFIIIAKEFCTKGKITKLLLEALEKTAEEEFK